MEQTIVEVKDKDIVETRTVKMVSFSIANVKLNDSCYIFYDLMDSSGKVIKHDLLKLDGEDYQNWTSDDNYVSNWVLSKLGLTKST